MTRVWNAKFAAARTLRLRRPARLLGAVVLATLLALPNLLPAGTAALQDGTGIEEPQLCAAPVVASGTPGAAPLAASPVAVPPQASPVAGQPAGADTTAEIQDLVETLAACVTTGEREAVAELVTENYLGAAYGGGGTLSREQYLELASQLPAIRMSILSVTGVLLTPSGASASVTYVLGNELVSGIWTFVPRETAATPGLASTPVSGAPAPSPWLVDAEEPGTVLPPADAETIQVRIREYDFALDRKQVPGPTVVLAGTNAGEEEHEMLVVRLGPGTTTDDLLRQPGPALPEGITYAGQVTVPAGGSGQLVLVDLEPGFYAIVCLLPDAEGIPHLALGMRDRFEIT